MHRRRRWRQPWRARTPVVALLMAGLTACGSSRGAGLQGAGSQGAGPASRSARVVAVQTLGPRVRDLTIDSPALGRRATYQSWTRSTDVEGLAALAGVLVVMPEAGQAGFYSDWYNRGRGGPPGWETFHLTELRQLLERDWRAGDRWVVAGISMGGLGAMAYAARHPGTFRAAASYSGLLHTRYQGGPVPGPGFVQNLVRGFGADPRALWGDPQRQADVWAAHDPYDLAPRLRGVDLFVSVGNGQPGPLDGPATTEQARRIEQAVQPQNLAFVERLHQLGIPVQFDAYGAGTHDWPYWQRELHRSLPLLLHALQRP